MENEKVGLWLFPYSSVIGTHRMIVSLHQEQQLSQRFLHCWKVKPSGATRRSRIVSICHGKKHLKMWPINKRGYKLVTHLFYQQAFGYLGIAVPCLWNNSLQGQQRRKKWIPAYGRQNNVISAKPTKILTA